MLSSLRKYLLVPKLMRLASSAPRDPHAAWDQYWGDIRSTGEPGEVLWDSGDDHEMLGYLEHLKRQLDPELPVVDVGCGSGSFSRRLAAHFPHVLGVDVSAQAIALARTESEGLEGISFATVDMSAPGAAQAVQTALAAAGMAGEANIFIRGVLHVLRPASRAALAEQLLPLVGKRGRVFLAETDFRGNAVAYVCHLGATRSFIPGPLAHAIRALPMPGRFGPVQRLRAFPESRWDLVEDGPAVIEAHPLTSAEPERIPGYFSVLQAR
jgi:SAM-dependent methyltransferase